MQQKHILLHVCCGPCAIVPVLRLREQGHKVTALFVNPNIHPLSEYLRRRETLLECAEKLDFPVILRDDTWDIHAWLAAVAGKQDSGAARCSYCYTSRLNVCAQMLQENLHDISPEQGGFTAFSSSLLYSRYQNHEQIIHSCQNAALKYGVAFHYEDFRDQWQKGIDISKELHLYRQAYCGCIYSEAERYTKKLKKCLAAN